VIQLRRLRWHNYSAKHNPVASALLSKMGMARSEHPRVLLTSLQMLARLGLDAARTRLISGFIDTYLHLTAHEQAQYEAELAELTPQEQEATIWNSPQAGRKKVFKRDCAKASKKQPAT
jgi:hypothetical protein